MKKYILIVVSLLLINCSSTQLVESWKNPEIDIYEPYKVLIIGLTSDTVARASFETKLKDEFESRGYVAFRSLDVIENPLKTDKMTESDLEDLESKLAEDGFDTIVLTKIIGVEDKVAYRKNYKGYDETYRKFKEDYLMYQDIYYNPDYYENYIIYHAETSMYCICQTKDRELLWKGYINITDPRSIEKTVNDYVTLALAVLEEEKLIKPLVTNVAEPIQ